MRQLVNCEKNSDGWDFEQYGWSWVNFKLGLNVSLERKYALKHNLQYNYISYVFCAHKDPGSVLAEDYKLDEVMVISKTNANYQVTFFCLNTKLKIWHNIVIYVVLIC